MPNSLANSAIVRSPHGAASVFLRRRPACWEREVSKSVVLLTGDRWFESISLQQTVRLSPASAFEGREPRLSARVCAAGLASGSAETRGAFRHLANWRQYLCRAIF